MRVAQLRGHPRRYRPVPPSTRENLSTSASPATATSADGLPTGLTKSTGGSGAIFIRVRHDFERQLEETRIRGLLMTRRN